MISGEELAAYAAGEADPALVARVESALSDDGRLVRQLAALRVVDAQLAQWQAPVLEPAEAVRLRAAIDADLARLGELPTASPAGVSAPDVVAASPATGADADGSRPSTAGARFLTWWRDLLDRPQAVVGWVGGVALAAVVLVVGGGVLGGLGGADDSADTTALEAAPAAREDNADGANDADDAAADAFASGGTEDATAAMSEAEMAESGDTLAGLDQASAAPFAIIDDGRVVQALADLDPAAVRTRLAPLAEGGNPAAPDESRATPEELPDTSSESAGRSRLADGRLGSGDLTAVRACVPETAEVPIMAEVILLAPSRDAILYVYPDRVIVVAVKDCVTVQQLDG